MAERKSVNKYYPPDWDPSKGSVNKHIGQHPLRDRARKLGEGILIIRFELPYSIWCGGCNELLATGLRFNAEKKNIGKYYSTPIWSFRMKCRFCSNWFEIHTNPKESSYDLVRGARKKAEPDDIIDNDDSVLADSIIDMVSSSSNRDGNLSALEVRNYRAKRARDATDRILSLQKTSDRQWKHNGDMNAMLRNYFRIGRKQREKDKKESEEIQNRTGLSIPILPSQAEDDVQASIIKFEGDDEQAARKRIRAERAAQPLVISRTNTGNSKCKIPTRSSNKLKSQLALRSFNTVDPFATTSIGNFSGQQHLGIRRKDKPYHESKRSNVGDISEAVERKQPDHNLQSTRDANSSLLPESKSLSLNIGYGSDSSSSDRSSGSL